MNKLKSFFTGIYLLAIVFAMVLVTSLLYLANERMKVKSYIFQVNNSATLRVGPMQEIKDVAANDLRNRLIKKYVTEYFKVIPGEENPTERQILQTLGPIAFEQWQNGEAKTISSMSAKKMFRMVRIPKDGIATITKMKNPNYDTKELAERVYYSVRYYMYTWKTPNTMDEQPTEEQGTLYIEAKFKPGIKDDIEYDGHKYNVRKYLETGLDPAGLFKFEVTNVGNKEDI